MKNNSMDEKMPKLSKKKVKIIAIVASIIAVLIAAVAIIHANQTAIYSRLILSFMPKSIVMEDESHIEYFVELSDNLNSDEVKENPLLAFSFYYFDESGNRIDLGPNATLVDENGYESSLSIAFLLKSALDGNIPNFSDITTIVVVVVVIIVCIGLSALWFIIWSKNEDKSKAAFKAKQNKKPQKKKKK